MKLFKKKKKKQPREERCLFFLSSLRGQIKLSFIRIYPSLLQSYFFQFLVLLLDIAQIFTVELSFELGFSLLAFWSHTPTDSFQICYFFKIELFCTVQSQTGKGRDWNVGFNQSFEIFPFLTCFNVTYSHTRVQGLQSHKNN